MNAALPVPSIWTNASTEAIKTGTWRAALPQHILAPSPCHAACPVAGEIAVWIGQARARDFRAAWQTLTLHNPFPSIAGRICHHPCESACNRDGHDQALSICKLERFVGDLAIEQGWSYPAAPTQRGERVAVVGAGPAGLSAAYQLRRLGYGVTLIESQSELGGLMRYGIPPYRLARAVLDAEIARIVALGVEVRCGQPMQTALDFAHLRAQFDAVYLALGARRQKRLPQLDYSQAWVLDGADYLARASVGATPALGPRLVVIGGGSAALDVARSARRGGHAVTILALEARDQMPAQREEVLEALEEGITLVDSATLSSVSQDGAGALRLDCERVRFEAGAQRGQFTLTPLAGGGFMLEADAVISAIGQDPDLTPVAAALDADGKLVRVDASGATSADGVWAGGDMASMARFVTEAIGMGERAALAIQRRLSEPDAANGADSAAAPTQGESLVALASINLHYHPTQARAADRRLGVTERLAHDSPALGPGAAGRGVGAAMAGTQAEVQLSLDMEQALAESARCFSCGLCTHCDNCVTYCPDFAVQRVGEHYQVLTDYCKGCGLCVNECPTGSMKMLEELR